MPGVSTRFDYVMLRLRVAHSSEAMKFHFIARGCSKIMNAALRQGILNDTTGTTDSQDETEMIILVNGMETIFLGGVITIVLREGIIMASPVIIMIDDLIAGLIRGGMIKMRPGIWRGEETFLIGIMATRNQIMAVM